MTVQTYSDLRSSAAVFPWRISNSEAETAARALWSGWDRMDDEERRVLLLEVHRALSAVAECRSPRENS